MTPATPTTRPVKDPWSGMRETLLPVWVHRKTILRGALLIAAATAVVNFLLLKPSFEARTSILPEADKGKLSALGQYAAVAQLAGVNVPGSEVARLYPAIVGSETVLRNVIAANYSAGGNPAGTDLVRWFKIEEDTPEENMAEAVTLLRSQLSASVEPKTGIVTVNLELDDPQLVSDVLNRIVAEVDRFMRDKRKGNASEQLAWIGTRLKDVKEELREAEETLKGFRERNRRVLDSPQLLMEQERLAREVTIKSTMFVELKKQEEIARIEEIKNVTIVNVLDPARPPVKKSGPRRVINTILAFLLGALAVSTLVVLRDRHETGFRDFLGHFRRTPSSRPAP